MKKIFSLLLVMAMLFSVCVPVCAETSQATLIYSYDSFESKASGVFEPGGGNWRSYEYSEDCANVGQVSIKSQGNENKTYGLLWLNHNITFEAGKTYSLRFYVRSAKSTTQIEARLYSNTLRKFVSETKSQRAISVGSWNEFICNFKWGSETSADNNIVIDIYSLCDVYIDDVELYEGALSYDTTQWKDAEYTEIVPGNATTAPLIPDEMTFYDYSMDFENGSSIYGHYQGSGTKITTVEGGNSAQRTQLVADPVDSDNTVLKVKLASTSIGDNNNEGLLYGKSTSDNGIVSGEIPAGGTVKFTFRYYIPDKVKSNPSNLSKHPSFCVSMYPLTSFATPTGALETTEKQWHTAILQWKNNTGSAKTAHGYQLRLTGTYPAEQKAWILEGHNGVGNPNDFGERTFYFDDFRITVEDSNGNIVKTESVVQKAASNGKYGNLYVDKNAAAGGNGSKKAPFNTIEAARDYIRTIKDSMTGDIIVNVKGGRYEIENTIEMTNEDSGKNGHYIIYQPYGYGTDDKEEVVLSGGKVVTGWKQSEISGVYCAPLNIDYVRNLYVNDKRAQRARYNEYVTPIEWWDDTNINYTVQRKNTETGETFLDTVYDGLVIPGGIIKNPEKATNLEIYRTATFRSGWAVKGRAYADGGNTIIKMAQPYFAMHKYGDYSILDWKITDNFRLENALEFLDEPGEWYHDTDAKMLYYMPRAGESIESCQVIAPNTEQLLTIAGSDIEERAENIIVRGFTFSDAAHKRTSRLGRANLQGPTCNTTLIDSLNRVNGGFQYETEGSIILTNAKNVSITDNIIKHMGGSGVMLPDGVDNCEVNGNAIYDISSSGIIIGSNIHFVVNDWRVVPRNIHITNNIVGNTGVEYGTDSGIHGYFTNGLLISHNEIFNTTYSAISLGWQWDSREDTKRNNVIEYNRIYNYGTECQDGGGIYTLGRQPGSAVRGNYLKAYAQYIVGLYHDSGSSGFVTSGNVVELPADTGEQGIYKNNIGDGDLFINENYFTNYERRFVSTTAATMRDNHTEQGAVRSPEALAIRENSGLTGSYASLRNKVEGYSENTQTQRIYLQTEEQKHQSPVNIATGESLTLRTYAEGKNGEMNVLSSGITYQVGDTSVLRVNGSKITGVAPGMTTVTATDSSGLSSQILVTVDDEVVSFEVIADKKSATVDQKVDINYRLKTKYTEIVGIPTMSAMTTNDTKIAKVLTDGSIKITGNGVATVSVSANVGGYSVNGSTTITAGADTFRTFKMLNYMSKLQQSDIESYLGSGTTVSETKYAEALAAVTESDISAFCDNPGTGNLTKERMVAIAADALVNVYGLAEIGDNELNYYSDKNQIAPELIPKIALAYRKGLLSWVDGNTVFEPKKVMTSADAAAFLYRLAHPEKSTYLRMEDHYFNNYGTVVEQLYKNINVKGIRKRTNQWGFTEVGEQCSELDSTDTTPYTPKSGVHAGTDGVTIDSGKLVRKVTRDNATETTIVTINDAKFVPGKSYVLTFDAKVATSGKSNSLEVKTLFSDNTGNLNSTINSSWKSFSVPIDVPENIEMKTSAQGIEYFDDNSVQIKFSNTFLNYTTCTVLLRDIVITEAGDISIASSSIKDGEENVMVPIDSIYLFTSAAVDTTSVTADKFTVTGATVRDAEAIDDCTIRVGIDGCTYNSTYTLTTSGVKNEIGGFLTGSVSWTTALPGGKGGNLDFEDSTYTGTTYGGISAKGISEEQAYKNNSSLKVTTTALTNLYLNSAKLNLPELEIGKTYYVSCAIYSTTASARIGLRKYHTTDEVLIKEKYVGINQWTVLSGTFTPTIQNHVADDIFQINLWGDPGDYYIDDITIYEIPENAVTVYRPNVFVGGVPVSGVAAGEATVKLRLKGDTKDRQVWVVMAQYEEHNRMTKMVHETVTLSAGEDKIITINLPDAKNLDTKIYVMGKTSYEPYSDVICMGKKE